MDAAAVVCGSDTGVVSIAGSIIVVSPTYRLRNDGHSDWFIFFVKVFWSTATDCMFSSFSNIDLAYNIHRQNPQSPPAKSIPTFSYVSQQAMPSVRSQNASSLSSKVASLSPPTNVFALSSEYTSSKPTHVLTYPHTTIPSCNVSLTLRGMDTRGTGGHRLRGTHCKCF